MFYHRVVFLPLLIVVRALLCWHSLHGGAVLFNLLRLQPLPLWLSACWWWIYPTVLVRSSPLWVCAVGPRVLYPTVVVRSIPLWLCCIWKKKQCQTVASNWSRWKKALCGLRVRIGYSRDVPRWGACQNHLDSTYGTVLAFIARLSRANSRRLLQHIGASSLSPSGATTIVH